MADKMMKVAGRGQDGTAKALSTDNSGKLQNAPNMIIKQTIARQGAATLVTGNTEYVIYPNIDFSKFTLSWYLSLMEINRPTAELANTLRIRIEFSYLPFDQTPTDIDIVYSHEVEFSQENLVNKGLLIDANTNSNHTNVILSGKPFNLPLARYMRLTLINTQSPNYTFKGIVLTEEGVY